MQTANSVIQDGQSSPPPPSGAAISPVDRKIKRAVIIVKETYLDQVRAAGDTKQLAEIAAKKPGLDKVEASHAQHELSIQLVETALQSQGIELDVIHRNSEGLKEHLEGKAIDLVVTVGGDGTMLRASHEINDKIAVVGVNSAPETSFGHFCISDGAGFSAVLARILDGTFRPSRLLRLNLTLNSAALPEPVLNEVLLAHKHPAETSRCYVTLSNRGITHKGSGLIVAAPAGTTGFNRSERGIVLPITARQYVFVERAPFPDIGKIPAAKTGLLDGKDSLLIVSQMQDGKLYVDGGHIEYDFPRGATLTVSAGACDLLAYIDPDCHSPYIV